MDSAVAGDIIALIGMKVLLREIERGRGCSEREEREVFAIALIGMKVRLIDRGRGGGGRERKCGERDIVALIGMQVRLLLRWFALVFGALF